MGRGIPGRPMESMGQVAAIVGGSLTMVLGVVWILFFVTMMIFSGLDLSEPVTGLGPRQNVGAAMVFLAMIGVLIVALGRLLFEAARRPEKSRRKH